MSTRLTSKDIPMVDSQTLQLVLSAGNVSDLTLQYLSTSLEKSGYDRITPSMLSFLSTLECGINYGSDIARDLGVSRQMVAKRVKELCSIGYLEQVDGSGKQKQILFTEVGERLISEARQLLADLDKMLTEQLGIKSFSRTVFDLSKIENVISELNNS